MNFWFPSFKYRQCRLGKRQSNNSCHQWISTSFHYSKLNFIKESPENKGKICIDTDCWKVTPMCSGLCKQVTSMWMASQSTTTRKLLSYDNVFIICTFIVMTSEVPNASKISYFKTISEAFQMVYYYRQTWNLKSLTNGEKSSKSPWIAHPLGCIINCHQHHWGGGVQKGNAVHTFVLLHYKQWQNPSKEMLTEAILNAGIESSSFHNTEPRGGTWPHTGSGENLTLRELSSLLFLVISKTTVGKILVSRYKSPFKIWRCVLSRKSSKKCSS